MNFVRIDDFPNYVIHPCGSICSLYKNKTTLMKSWKDKGGYTIVGLRDKPGHQQHLKLHRLLALHFIPNPENKPLIDHINGIRNDNRLENLRWATYKENANNRIIKPITKGNIYLRYNGTFKWMYRINGKGKSKTMKSKDALEKYRDETLKKYLN
tara:strand:- start:145 stop:609 length:465 start_codon:yes stop_codon:yes gene_type:complete